MSLHILNINPGSDGDGRRRPRTDDFTRNDDHYLDRIADLWAKDQELPSGSHYRLNQLPHGFSGYEKPRASEPKHVDRYVYGHEKGVYRSVTEFWPHFKHLMQNGNAFGCPCKLCTGTGGKKGPGARIGNEAASGSASRQSPYFAKPAPSVPRGKDLLGVAPSRSPPPQRRRKQVDEEGTPDVYRVLIDKLKAAGADRQVDELIIESMSPDWRTSHMKLAKELKQWRSLPAYVPRKGELVLFVRDLDDHETLGWDSSAQTFRILDRAMRSWVGKPRWEAGVVTQMPTESVANDDLTAGSTNQQSVTLTGFRVEPLPQVGSSNKAYTKQHKYVPLHALRPLCLWKECQQGLGEQDWHPTVRNALAVTNTIAVISKYHFKGQWPEATIFCQGAYLGPELVQLGDAVRLHPKANEKQEVADVMVITAIKMRLVNLEEANDDDQDGGHPYNTCTHISGRMYTQDPTKSYDGVGKVPIVEDSETLHPSMRGTGTWYHVCDPKKEKARIEVPYTRIIGRCYDAPAIQAWFTGPKGIAPPAAGGFQAVNSAPPTRTDTPSLSRGLNGILEARKYAYDHDPRIDKTAGKSWFWADTRVEALDVHEVNSRWVSSKDPERTLSKVDGWRRALRALDGKKGGLEEYHAARRQKEQEQNRREAELAGSGAGMMAGGAQAAAGVESGLGTEPVTEAEGTGEEEEEEGREDVMEVDATPVTKGPQPPADMDDDSDLEMVEPSGGALAAFKSAAGGAAPSPHTFATGAPGASTAPLGLAQREVIELEDD